MDMQTLRRGFTTMGARARILTRDRVGIDIGTDRRGEFFDIEVARRTPTPRVLDLAPRDRHLLLELDGARFLCGHDERHWFVAAVPEGRRAGNVEQAKEALMPDAAQASLAERRVKRRHRLRRHNDAFIRQGEWFFIPAPQLRVNERLVLHDEPLRRGGGKPHLVRDLYRTGGELVYVSRIRPDGLTETAWRQWRADHPRDRTVWRSMRRDMTVYARGTVSHPDHATIRLRGWHLVAMNTEGDARVMQAPEHARIMRFLD